MWRRSTTLDMILGSVLEKLSSVKPMTALDWITAPSFWLPRKIASFYGDEEAIETEYRHMISVTS